MSPAAKGSVPQRELARRIILLVDAARASNSTAHKDQALAGLRALLTDPEVHWETPFVYHNLGARRCRFLNSIGLWVPMRWTEGGWTGPKNEPAEEQE